MPLPGYIHDAGCGAIAGGFPGANIGGFVFRMRFSAYHRPRASGLAGLSGGADPAVRFSSSSIFFA